MGKISKLLSACHCLAVSGQNVSSHDMDGLKWWLDILPLLVCSFDARASENKHNSKPGLWSTVKVSYYDVLQKAQILMQQIITSPLTVLERIEVTTRSC